MTRRSIPWLVLAGVLVAALSLRTHLTSIPPVVTQMMSDLGVSAAEIGLLTTAPVFMFALFTPIAALVIRRAGPELALLLTLLGVLVGTLVRLGPSYGWVMAGMIVMGVAITIGNVVVPVIIRRDVPPEHAATATAAYSAMLNLGTVASTLGTAPLAEAIGWSPALVAWAILTVAGVALWLVHMVRRREASERPTRRAQLRSDEPTDVTATITGPIPIVREVSLRRVLARPVLWLLTLAFALQSVAYFALTAWLPTLLGDTTGVPPTTAGAMASIFQGVAVLGPFLVPLLWRKTGPVGAGVAISVCWIVMTVGMLIDPGSFWIWAACGAIGHAGGFVVIFTSVVHVAGSGSEAATMSAVVQAGGYLIGMTGAPLMGGLYESTGAWTVPLLVVTAVVVVYAAVLIPATLIVRRQAG